MKIAVIAPSQVPSNTANSIQVMKVCQAFVQNGHEVCLWVPSMQQSDLPQMRDARRMSWEHLSAYYGITTRFDIRWLHAPLLWRRYDFAWNALRQAHAWGAVVVYTWMLQAGVLALLQKMPAVVEIHMLPTGRAGPWLFQQLVKLPGRKRILPITDALRRQLEQKYHFQFNVLELQIAPMGTEPEQYAGLPVDPADARHQLGLPQALTVGYTGHFYTGRGMDLLLGLAEAFPQTSFLWIGGRDADVEYWRGQLQEAGMTNIILTGFVENARLPLYQAAADILLMPYGSTIGVSSGGNTADVCSPMKMFDYLSAGRPIITSDLAVLREVLNENNAAFCPPDDLDAWKSALAALLVDDDHRQRLAAQAKEDAKHYTWRSRAEESLRGFGK